MTVRRCWPLDQDLECVAEEVHAEHEEQHGHHGGVVGDEPRLGAVKHRVEALSADQVADDRHDHGYRSDRCEDGDSADGVTGRQRKR